MSLNEKKYKIEIQIQDLLDIDLSEISNFISDEQAKSYFLAQVGEEHYKLLAYLSTFFNDVLIYDIGTYKGSSAIALSYNKNNRVRSLDIIDNKTITSQPKNIEWIIGDFLKEPVSDVLSSPLIMIDIDHTGKHEKLMLDFLVEIGWQGFLLFDDIYFNKEMNDFWNSIQYKKCDLTKIGHFSGTGMVLF